MFQQSTLRILTRLGVLAILLICATVLAGWVLNIPALASIVPGWPRMALIVLVCHLLCACALLELTFSGENRYSRLARVVLAGTVFLLALDALVAVMLGSLTGGTPSPLFKMLVSAELGNPSVASALDFLLVATALMLPRAARWEKLYSLLLAAGLAITGIDFVGYAYGITALSRGPTLSAMSLPTMSCFILLFLSALLARPRAGWTAVFFSSDSGGIAARRMFPAVLVLPFIVNGIVVLVYRSSPFEALFGFAILAVAMSLGLGIIIVTISSWLSRYEAERIAERRNAERRVQTQMGRMALLERITRAVGQRQDIASIFQVVVRTLEDRLPADLVCICTAAEDALVVGHVGAGSRKLAQGLGIVEREKIAVGENGLSRCMQGALVHEPDITQADFDFPRRLARHGLGSVVFTPLAIEARVLGVLITARLEPFSFTSTDCEFLRQLGEHVALAANQARLRDSLEAAYDDLKQTQQLVLQQERLGALGQMASGIAHDINNAISPVAVYTKSLLEREQGLSSHMRDYLEIVGRVVNDVSATVGRMRDFYRRGDAEAEFAPVILNDLVPQVVELTRARWSDMPQQRGIVITVATELESGLPPVMGNASELREALTNLIFNAVDAMPQGGAITIRTVSTGKADAARVRLEVADTGVGMDDETRQRCLEPFFTTKGQRGTGLGLAMVYGAAERHKAALDIASAPGAGTSFRLEFAAAQVESAPEPAPQAIETGPLRLLLVDDDPSVLHSTHVVLELDGHAIIAADGGEAGIAALKAAKAAGESFDVMVTDLGMPYVDGNQVARTAKELFPDMMVVLLTGWGRKMNDRDQSTAHIDHMLAKPLDIDELRALFARRPAQ